MNLQKTFTFFLVLITFSAFSEEKNNKKEEDLKQNAKLHTISPRSSIKFEQKLDSRVFEEFEEYAKDPKVVPIYTSIHSYKSTNLPNSIRPVPPSSDPIFFSDKIINNKGETSLYFAEANWEYYYSNTNSKASNYKLSPSTKVRKLTLKNLPQYIKMDPQGTLYKVYKNEKNEIITDKIDRLPKNEILNPIVLNFKSYSNTQKDIYEINDMNILDAENEWKNFYNSIK